ncbi:Uncharacterized protein BP5553_09559 [Venustampulla echinocandica]|uniref:Glycosyltransferase family 31 protein n=1 Tax=Venustampulla echinocandica TaxID=2656787 RepID=A0A370TBD0_9HELO|nr:Uncharacterized protein BP5553_09559 [Venustampulla echinocandica]RDL31350.1 Uncharacterized protein BP5553_09559 [Venustampulla echinocandica]
MSIPFTVAATSPSMRPRTPLYRWLALFFIVVFIYYYLPTSTVVSIPRFSTSKASVYSSPNSSELSQVSWVKRVLKDYSIGPEITYATRTLQYIPDAKDRPLLTSVDHDLFEYGFQDLSLDTISSLPEGPSLGVHVKKLMRPSDADGSSLMIGVSTTFKRFNDKVNGPIKEWARWLTDGKGGSNGAHLVLALFQVTSGEINTARQHLAAAGINATVIASKRDLDMPGRYVDLVRMLYTHPMRSQRKYFALIDDDTFFPYMSQLALTLSEYDHNKPYYIGTFTERVDWMLANHVPMAYGGGGVFLTTPVAQKIAELPCLEKTPEGTYILNATEGDRLLYNCLHSYTEITLTHLPSLHQVDQFGDPSGFYESGQQPLSLHHYKSWHHAEPAKIHLVADACGEDCVLQRFQFKDNFVVANGFSIAEYPKGIDFDLEKVEGTFEVPQGDTQDVLLSYSFGDMRKNLAKSGRKRSWTLLDSRTESEGKVQQIYAKKKDDSRWVGVGEQLPERDSVAVLTWVP